MTHSQINKFIKRYGGPHIDFFMDSKKQRSLAATTYFLGINPRTNKPKYVIGLQKDVFKTKVLNKQYNNAYLKAIMLHEIGHIKRRHFLKRISPANAEFEAQAFALHLAETRHFNLIMFFVVSVFMGWSTMRNTKKFNHYFKAYCKFYRMIGKARIKMFRSFLNKCELIS
jgi:hypothetical protein